jgi:hypothetical protein
MFVCMSVRLYVRMCGDRELRLGHSSHAEGEIRLLYSILFKTAVSHRNRNMFATQQCGLSKTGCVAATHSNGAIVNETLSHVSRAHAVWVVICVHWAAEMS